MGPLILLVDDEEIYLSVLETALTGRYSVLKARSGKEALDLLQKHQVQLVISDVMMPEMDGYVLCSRIKSNIDFAQIPVVLLTAKNTMDAKVAGLELGADAYIEKPFSVAYLLAQIASLLYNRMKIAEFFSLSPGTVPAVDPRIVDSWGKEDQFLNELKRSIRNHMHDPTLGIMKLAELMAMSRISLYRRVKESSDLSPAELITIARLEKAAALMATGRYRIGEIAGLVGFSNPGRLTRNFLRYYKKTPVEYVRSLRQSPPQSD
jgi:two-component system, cell cycle response regulator